MADPVSKKRGSDHDAIRDGGGGGSGSGIHFTESHGGEDGENEVETHHLRPAGGGEAKGPGSPQHTHSGAHPAAEQAAADWGGRSTNDQTTIPTIKHGSKFSTDSVPSPTRNTGQVVDRAVLGGEGCSFDASRGV